MKPYRAEVDGLRALAVLPVILFHAGVQAVPGGFLGVDVFFVISGYLISRIILDEMEAGRFSLLSFYERRARRILPALFVVMAFTFPFAWWLAPPDTFSSYLASLRATALFFSNIHFWQSLGYFNPTAEDQPLLHTWSLGVEEQFYILFPLLLWLAWRFARRYLLTVFAVLLLAFFAVCLFQLSQSREAAFFLLHARAWELFAGVIVTLLERRLDVAALRRHRLVQAFAVAGLVSIATGFFVVTASADAPGWPSLWPVAGTIIVLLCAGAGGTAGRMLSAKPVVALGLISYGAYLWHHPLFAFARLYSLDEPKLWLMLVLAVLALVLAAITYHLVEKPFRNRNNLARPTVMGLSMATIAGIVALSSVGLLRDWAETRYGPAMLAKVLPPLYKTENCNWVSPDADMLEIRICYFGVVDGPNPVILWGDSHAQALVGEMDQALKARGWSGLYVNTSRCLRVPGIFDLSNNIEREAAKCSGRQKRVYTIMAAMKPRAIVVNLRWTMRLFPLPGAGPTAGFDNGEGGIEVEQARELVALDANGQWSVGEDAKSRAVAAFFTTLERMAPLVVMGPVPEVGWHVGNRNFKTSILRNEALPEITTSFDVFKSRNGAVLRMLDAASAQQPYARVEPSSLFCDTMVKGRCVAQHEGVSYYSDDDHVSQTGARMLVERIMAAVPSQP
jgi:peptidoglycan/LPS O-acetylase OafA/YrhL